MITKSRDASALVAFRFSTAIPDAARVVGGLATFKNLLICSYAADVPSRNYDIIVVHLDWI